MDKKTKYIHSGEELISGVKPISFPIYLTSAFSYDSLEEMADASQDLLKYRYSRKSNPTARALEKKMADLEGTEDGITFSTGMSAISSTLLSLLKAGDEIIALRDLYGGTFELLTNLLTKLGIKVTLINTEDLPKLEQYLNPNTKILFIESPTNPMLKIVNIKETVEIAHNHNVIVCMDNSLASLVNQTPHDFGVDIVIYSTTKHISGHNDVMGGIVLANKEICSKLRQLRVVLGGIMTPLDAWLTLRSIKTVSIRVLEENSNALKIAQMLQQCEGIAQVIYPGLPSHPQYQLAQEQMTGFGTIITFSLKPTVNISTFFKKLKILKIAVGLGGVESLIEPVSLGVLANISTSGTRENEMQFIRISVGLESPDDIFNDVAQALT